MQSRIVLLVLVVGAGVGMACGLPSVKGNIAQLDSLLADADDMLKDHRSAVIVQVNGPDELETALEVHRMSYLARRDELVIRLWTFSIAGPLCVLVGLAGLVHAMVTARLRKRRHKPARRRPRVQKRS